MCMHTLLTATHAPPPPPRHLPTDAYKVTEESTVVLAAPQPPLIKLDDKHYKCVAGAVQLGVVGGTRGWVWGASGCRC